MIGVTVEYQALTPPKVIHRDFKESKDAVSFMLALKGEQICAYTDDGQNAVYIGESENK